jgi:hypothetical protein
MHGAEFDVGADEPTPCADEEPVIDFESDPIDVGEEVEDIPSPSVFFSEEPGRRVDQSELTRKDGRVTSWP